MVTQLQAAVQPENTSLTLTKEKPKILNRISELIFLIAILYVFSTIGTLGVYYVIDHVFSSGELALSFLKNFPTWGLIPIMFSFVSLIFFYVAIKVRNGSKFSFWLGVFFLLAIPLLTVLINQILMSPFIKFLSKGIEEVTESGSFNPILFRFSYAIFIFVLISLILLIFSFKKFQFPNTPLTTKARVFLILLALFLILPTIILVSLGYIRASDTDYGYTYASSQVTYHVYKPSSLPPGLDYATKFMVGKELAGKQNAIQVSYDVGFDKAFNPEQSKIIVLKQVEVEPGFDLYTFASTLFKDADPSQTVTLSKAANQTAYFIERNLEKIKINTLTFVTIDNVLIQISTPKASQEELIQFAESLR